MKWVRWGNSGTLARHKRKTRHTDRATKSGAGAPPSAGAPAEAIAAAPRRRPSRPLWLGALGVAVIVLLAALTFHLLGNRPRADSSAAPTFVGSTTCAECHRPQADPWRPSQHNLAMQHASAATVLGNFNDAGFDYAGVHSRFFRKDGKFFVETDGRDGKLAVFEVKYTFGVDPLQQYLVEFPDGRVQALLIAWDSRPADKGGQRWFHLYPERAHPARRRAALDPAEPELELHVRGVPLDGRAEELRRRQQPLRHHVGRVECRL